MALFYPKIETMGIDLSDRSIKVGKAKKKGDSFILESLGEKNIPSGFINDGIINKDKEKEIISIIQQCLKEVKGSKILTKKAVCSLPEEDSFIKIIQIPKTREEEVGEVVKWQIESNFPVKLKDVSFDWQVVSSGARGEEKTMSVCVAVVPIAIVNSYLSIFSNCGIEPVVFEIESMSLVRGIIDKYVKKPIIIIDFGQCGTGLTFFSGSTILFTSHIDISGQKITESIAKSLKISFDEAENLKRSIGLAGMNEKSSILNGNKVGPREIFSALVPVLTDLTEQIKHYIDYFKDFKNVDNVPAGNIEKIVICGGESRLIGLSDFLSQTIGISVDLGNPLKNVIISKKISKNINQKEFLSYSTLIGLTKRVVE